MEPQAIEVEILSATAAIVTLRGEHDIASKPEIASALEVVSGRARVVVDLCECTFVDSAVISVLLRALNSLTTRGGSLELVLPFGAHRAVRRVFELMGLQRLLPVHETRAAAIEYLASPPSATTKAVMRLRALNEIIDESLVEPEHRRTA